MQAQKLVQNHDDFPNTHCFVYKNKEFPIKYDFFRISSKLFSNNQIKVQENQKINLIDEESGESHFNSDESIQNFINFVHHQNIYLNNDNVI